MLVVRTLSFEGWLRMLMQLAMYVLLVLTTAILWFVSSKPSVWRVLGLSFAWTVWLYWVSWGHGGWFVCGTMAVIVVTMVALTTFMYKKDLIGRHNQSASEYVDGMETERIDDE